MFDTWLGQINLTNVVLVFSVVVILPLQVFLCFKVKSRLLCGLPTLLFALGGAACAVIGLGMTEWSGFFCFLLALYAAVMLLASLAGWGIWLLVRFFKRFLS